MKKKQKSKSSIAIAFIAFLLLVNAALVACNANSSKNKYYLAEKLLEDKKYEAAISEFQEVIDKEPFTELGRSALLKMAQIQHLYLGRAKEAEVNYELFLKRNKDESIKSEIEKTLAKLSFEIFEDYQKAIVRYKQLLEKYPNDAMADQYSFNIARAYYLLSKFDEAKSSFEDVQKQFPNSIFSQKASLEMANVMAANGDCEEAIKQYDKVSLTKDENLISLAKFGKASCLEEIGDLDGAYEKLQEIKESYPAPVIVDLKMKKIKRRKILRRR